MLDDGCVVAPGGLGQVHNLGESRNIISPCFLCRSTAFDYAFNKIFIAPTSSSYMSIFLRSCNDENANVAFYE